MPPSASLHKPKRVLLAAVSVLLTLASGLIAVFESGDERLGGLAGALLFGSCMLVFLMPAFTRAQGPGRRVGVVSHRGLRTEALVFPLSRPKLRIAGIAAVGWAAAGALITIAPSGLADPGEDTTFIRLLGVVVVLLFGTVAAIAGLQELRGRGFVALLPQGVLARTVGGGSFIPWDAIEDVGVIEMYDTPMVAIRATDPAAVETPRWARLLSRASRAVVHADATYSSLVAPEQDLAEAIAHYVEHPEERARVGQDHRYNSRPPSTVPR